MRDDVELLRAYAQDGSEEAFSELVARHLPLVYSAAMRQANGDQELAKDATQTVFIDLARKAGSLSRRVLLSGWLYTSTRFAVSNAVRGEQRRRTRERKAMDERIDASTPGPAWDALGPVLDEAMAQLDVGDRDAVLLRFFERKQLKEVGAALEVTEDAARMRINRALEKLRSMLERRGVAISAAALGVALAEGAVGAAPAGLAPAIAVAALAGVTGSSAVLSPVLRALAMSKAKVGVISAIVVAVVATPLALKRPAQPRTADVVQPIPGSSPTTTSVDVAPNASEGTVASQPVTSELEPSEPGGPGPGVPMPGRLPLAMPRQRRPVPQAMPGRPEAVPGIVPAIPRVARSELPVRALHVVEPQGTAAQLGLGLRGITNSALLKALEKVPHGAFVVAGAITNRAGWSMEWPYTVARLSECLDPHPTERVLQLGIGSGYEAAVLAELFRAVYVVEPRAEVLQQARANLERSGCTNNIFVRQGELAAGWLEASPFDKIVFNGSPEQLSTALIYQLKKEGRLVIVVDEEKAIQVFEKAGGVLNPRGSVPLVPTPLSLAPGPRLLPLAPTAH